MPPKKTKSPSTNGRTSIHCSTCWMKFWMSLNQVKGIESKFYEECQWNKCGGEIMIKFLIM
jgi:DNA-directed RNA polymerase subunit RPC12/RpoP